MLSICKSIFGIGNKEPVNRIQRDRQRLIEGEKDPNIKQELKKENTIEIIDRDYQETNCLAKN